MEKRRNRILVFVNGYGARATDDPAYVRYLGSVRVFLEENAESELILVPAGGYTDSDRKTEAESIVEWFASRDALKGIQVVKIESTRSARENVCELRRRFGPMERTVLFCEVTRAPLMKFFVWKAGFKNGDVRGIAFDEASLELTAITKQAFKTGLEIAAVYVPPAEWLRRALREQRIRDAREERRKKGRSDI